MSSPPYDLHAALGFQFPDEAVTWNKRDTILYALSIGAHRDDFKVVYEKDPNFQVFPTFATTLSFKGTETDVFDFASKFGGEPKPPSLPKFDATKLVQASQYYENLKPLPAASGDGWKVTKTIVGIHEHPDGVTTDNEITLVGPDGQKYARMIAQAKYLGAVANGTPYDEMISTGMPPHPPIATLGSPKWTAKGPTDPTQSVLYRLNGDYNPLHIDPAVGTKLGYGGLICHGLCMYSITARAILEKMSESDPSRLKAMTALFSGPITPGDTLQVNIWEVGGAGPDGSIMIAFEARNGKGNLCLGEGSAYVVKTKVQPELNPIASGFTGPASPAPRVIPANGPKAEEDSINYPQIRGFPVKALFGVIFWAPAIIANLLYVAISYYLTWWFQW